MLIPLEISMTYPVSWSQENVARDFVQNFYDSIGPQNFNKDFQVREKDGDTYLETYGHPFSYEWLIPIGASTKTFQEGKYVGQFGEGYKMCVLTCMQNGWCNPVMESMNWRLIPCIYEEMIAGKKIKMLGYNKEKREDDGYTRLILKRNSWINWELLVNEAKLEFFYEENPLFGRMIYDSSNLNIYERSQMAIPCRESLDQPIAGIMYCNNLARGRLPIKYNIVLRGNMKKYDTRNRNTFFPVQVRNILIHEMETWSAGTCLMLLCLLKDYWNDMPKRTTDLDTWYYVICHLVRKVASDKEVSDKFLESFHNLYYIDRKTGDRKTNRIIRDTEEWAKKQNKNKDRMIVNPIFRLLGAKSLVQEYKDKHEIMYDDPTEKETLKLQILFDAIETIVSYRIYEKRPKIKIDRSNPGQASHIVMKRIYVKGDRRKYEITKIIMQEKDLKSVEFYNIFMKMAVQITSIYGSGRCAYVNSLLTELAGCVVKYRKCLDESEDLWNA